LLKDIQKSADDAEKRAKEAEKAAEHAEKMAQDSEKKRTEELRKQAEAEAKRSREEADELKKSQTKGPQATKGKRIKGTFGGKPEQSFAGVHCDRFDVQVLDMHCLARAVQFVHRRLDCMGDKSADPSDKGRH
jgi:septal ring-binding cell division protein DamX